MLETGKMSKTEKILIQRISGLLTQLGRRIIGHCLQCQCLTETA